MLENLYVRSVYKYEEYGMCAYDGTRIIANFSKQSGATNLSQQMLPEKCLKLKGTCLKSATK